MTSPLSDMATVAIHRPFADCFAFLSSPHRLLSWSRGITDARVVEPDSIVGPFKGHAEYWARIDADAARGSILYHLGPDRAALVPRIMIQIVDGAHLGLGPGTCLVSMMAWRSAETDDADWQRLVEAHAGEVAHIKELIEAGA